MSRIAIVSRWAVVGLMLAAAPSVFGQRWEFGAGGGASFFTNETLTSPAGSVTAGFAPGYGLTAYAAQTGRRYGGEIRYAFLLNDMKLDGMGRSFTFGGRSQLVTYDFSVFMGGKEAKVRPYISVGGGIRQFSGTGEDMAVQPLGSVAVLTHTSQWKPVISGGRLNSHP